MRMNLLNAITRKLERGDLRIERDDRGPFIVYDRLEVSFARGTVRVSLMAKNVVVDSTEFSMYEVVDMLKPLNIGNLEGRMRLDETPANGIAYNRPIKF